MFRYLKQYFNFNRGERIGILVVIAIIIVVTILPSLIPDSINQNDDEYLRFANDIEQFEKSIRNATDSMNEARRLDFQRMDKSVAENKLSPYIFNPNNLPSEQWSRLGLKDWQIKVIKRYESKGGKFYKKEDFRRMSCISPSEYEILAPYILIPEPQNDFTARKPEVTEINKKVMVDLNTADSVTLLTLYGIGPSFSRRIIKYRSLLGGFYRKSQLLEVYGFDQDRLSKIEDYCTLSPESITKINVNQVRTDELRKHPYFGYATAKAIVDQRIILVKYTSLQQIAAIPQINSETFDKIKNYLVLE